MSYNYFYKGSVSSLDPESGDLYSGVRIPAGELGATTSVQTANQIKEVTNLLNQGIANIEVSMIQAEVLEMIPKQHLAEINRLSKLTGAETSLHAPLVDPSGFTQQGWNETNREDAIRQLSGIMERAHELNPKGNIPVTVHASGIGGTESVPEKEGEVTQRMAAVNRQTGELNALPREIMFSPQEPEGKIHTPEQRLDMLNNTQWSNKITQIAFYKKEADEILGRSQAVIQPFLEKVEKGEEMSQEELQRFQPALQQIKRAGLFLDNVSQSFRGLYEDAAKFPDDNYKEDTRNKLKLISSEWEKLKKDVELKKGRVTEPEYIVRQSKLLDDSLNLMESIHPPQVFQKAEEFVQDKASDTFAKVALNAYKKYGETAPIVSIENPPYGMAVSRAEDLKKLIENSREKFVKEASKQGISEDKARDAAEKIIGATWDTSHISMMRKQGFKPEKLIDEAKSIAPFVKHVHYNDNFGSTHTDLPPGMGSVPMKEIVKELEKAGFKGKKIFEGGAFFQHFQQSPHPYLLESSGSPIFASGGAPYWNQVRNTYGNYFSGFGTTLPDQHFSMYGAGFSTLPTELGGQIPGKQSRLSGAPME